MAQQGGRCRIHSATGESLWDPPTPTFPAIVAASSSRVGGVSGNKVGAAWAGDAAAATMASSTTAPWPGGDVDYDDGGGGALGNVIVQAVASERTRETHWLSAVDVDKIVDGLYEDDVDDRCPTWSD